jgi:RNA polymerase sigma-70 factor (ECF subfamily)
MALAPRDPGRRSDRTSEGHAGPGTIRARAPTEPGDLSGEPLGSSAHGRSALDPSAYDSDGTEIAEGLRARDPSTIERFLEQYRALLLHCIGQFESAPGAREDLYQEVVGYLLERLDRSSFDARKGTFGTWVYRVAWCRCVDLKRRENAGRRLPTVPASDEPVEPTDEAPGPAEAAGDSEVGELVRRCLAELPEEEAELLRMRHMRDMTLVDIAAARSQTLETVKYRLRRATRALRQRLAARRLSPEGVP